jgi:hypothetical protein
MLRTYISAVAVVALAAAAGCNNDSITAFNDNPNAPTSVPPAAVFSNAAQNSAANWLGSTYDLRDIELIVQHLAENQYIGNDQYKGLTSTSFNTLFQSAYGVDLEDFQVVVRAGRAANDASLWAPALIMQQWEFGYLTDTFGDVPYSQALAADSTTKVLAPAYDTQQSIYNGFFTNLQSASTALQGTSASSLGSADVIYGGSKTKWQKFANSLHARDALRIVNVDPTKANAELTAAFAAPGGVFTSNADNAQLNWPGDGVFNNPWAVNFSSRDDDRMSKTLIDTLNHYNDPRVRIYAMPAAATGTYAGQPNGLTNAAAVAYSDQASRPGAMFYPGPVAYGTGSYGGNGNRQPSYLMTYAELSFIEAEAAARGLGGLTPAQAAGFYTAGITASMEQWGVASSDIATYLAQPSVAYQGGTAGLKQIALQKWIALYSDGGQAWFEWRRTCTPNLVPALNNNSLGYVPRRAKYPIIEQQANAEQLQAAVSRQGDTYNSRVWWDKAGAPTCP